MGHDEALQHFNSRDERTSGDRGSVVDGDDPRSHLHAEEEFEDVPYHGYVFECDEPDWNGLAGNPTDHVLNFQERSAQEMVDGFMV